MMFRFIYMLTTLLPFCWLVSLFQSQDFLLGKFVIVSGLLLERGLDFCFYPCSCQARSIFQLSCGQAGSLSQGSHTQCPPGIRHGTSAGVVKLIEDSRAQKPLYLTPLQGINVSSPQGKIMQNKPKTINHDNKSL